MSEQDYAKIGLRMGLECHQQLATQHKLFCSCSTHRSEDFPLRVQRKIRAVAGELGETDIAAKHEQSKDVLQVYTANPATACLIDFDESPPNPMNKEALAIALQTCKLFHSAPVGEVHIMRKSVADGSNTSGFQRTSLVGQGGFIETSAGKVRITNLQLEEDAATFVDRKPGENTWRLDRLGVPLIELSTEPDIKTPEHLYETALAIGSLFRATYKVKRGIGTIRQDLNISIAGGNRIEIKGAQELKMLPEYAKREIQRQQALIAVAGELKKRKAKVGTEIVDVSDLFKDTNCRFMKGKHVSAIALHGFDKLLGKEVQPGRRIGTELSDRAKQAGVNGIIHSDEDMKKYQIDELDAVKKRLGSDAVVMVCAEPTIAKKALEFVIARANQFMVGVPSEVRRALPDGNSEFLRPMPGAARLYPETDSQPVVITNEMFDNIELPEMPAATLKRLKAQMSTDLAEKLVSSNALLLFDRIKTKKPEFVAHVLIDVFTELRREGIDTDMLEDDELVELFALFDKGAFAKESIADVIRAIAFNPNADIAALVQANFLKTGEKEVREAVKAIAKRSGIKADDPRAFEKLMGDVMAQLRGKADGQMIAKVVKEEIKNV